MELCQLYGVPFILTAAVKYRFAAAASVEFSSRGTTETTAFVEGVLWELGHLLLVCHNFECRDFTERE
jgi:hypothetical protein